MRPSANIAGLFAFLLAAVCGCSQNGNLTNQQATWQQQYQQQMQQYTAQLQEAQRRANNLDVNNRDLHAQLAQSQQQLHRIVQENALVRSGWTKRPANWRKRFRRSSRSTNASRAIEASVRMRGGASITANSSLNATLPLAEIPDVEVRRDGDVIRIELPADRVFLPGSSTLHQGAFPLIDQVAAVVSRNYANQIIVIEGHTDNSPILGGPGSSNVQLSTAQAMAIYQQLTTRHRMNAAQLRVFGCGSGNPIVSNATTAGKARNRRVELVVYPETVGG